MLGFYVSTLRKGTNKDGNNSIFVDRDRRPAILMYSNEPQKKLSKILILTVYPSSEKT